MAEASVLPTLFSDVHVYVPSSCSFTRNKRRLFPLRISNLGMGKREIMKDLTETEKNDHATNLFKAKKISQWNKVMLFLSLSINLLQGFFFFFNQVTLS